MKEFDLVLDGSNLLLHGITAENQSTTVIRFKNFTSKLEYFLNLGYRSLLCFDRSTMDKFERGKFTIDVPLGKLEGLLTSHGVQYIYSDHQIAEFALQYGVPVVTNDKFDDWRKGTKTHKRSQVSLEEWAILHKQSIRHSTDKKGRFMVTPPLKNKTDEFFSHLRVNQMARENLRLKNEIESLRRQKELQSATINSLRKSLSIG